MPLISDNWLLSNVDRKIIQSVMSSYKIVKSTKNATHKNNKRENLQSTHKAQCSRKSSGCVQVGGANPTHDNKQQLLLY